MIKINYKQFLLEKLNNQTLSYFCFDYDDNILVMPTIIHVEHKINGNWIPTDLSTAQFAEVRTQIANSTSTNTDWRLKNGSYEDTYCEFRDAGPRGNNAFMEDTIRAIKTNSFGPVWDRFIKCMIDGHIFMIITARGHEPITIRNAVSWIIFNYITKSQKEEMKKNLKEFNVLFGQDDNSWSFDDFVNHYLDMCDFMGIQSNYFKNKFHTNTKGQISSPEKFKSIAIRYFTEKITNFGKKVNRKVKVGFSDDDTLTAQHVHKYMKNELSLDFPIDFNVYHTKDGIVKL